MQKHTYTYGIQETLITLYKNSLTKYDLKGSCIIYIQDMVIYITYLF